MTELTSCIYRGEVVHVRVAPKRHRLSMRVFKLLLDVEQLDHISRRLWLFSYNRFNLFSIADRKWAEKSAVPIATQVRALAEAATGSGSAHRIFMLCFPAFMGFVFNPLTTYYCIDRAGKLCCLVFEVSNTFGQRHSYVVPAEAAGGRHAKHFHVSPFNKVEGAYSFRADLPAERMRLTVSLYGTGGLTLNTWFAGERKELTDWELLKAFVCIPLLPLQVMGAIHWQALKLWWKGLAVNATPGPPARTVSFSLGSAGTSQSNLEGRNT